MSKGTKNIIMILCGLLFLVFAYSFFHTDYSTNRTVEEPGKTFQQKDENTSLDVLDKIGVWKRANFDQRITLCAAMAIQLNKDLKGEKISAMDMHNCIEEATRGLDEVDDLTIIQVASLCVSQLKK